MGVFHKFRFFNRRLALACAIIAVSTFNYGFDNQAFASTQAMDAFEKQFGVYNAKTGAYALEPYWLSLFNSMNYIGFAIGVIAGSMIASRWGRKRCMFIMSLYAIVTATIAVTSQNRSQIMAARILNYVYVGIELAVVPTYQSEIVPGPVRGLVVGSYQLSLIAGGLVINSVCYSTSTLPDNRAWRIPLGLFYIVPAIVASLVLFIPESPRWLLRQNRVEEAKENLRKLREGAFSDEDIEFEFKELQYSLAQEVEQGRFVELFQGINLKRTGIAALVNIFQQATGQAFASQYGAVFVKGLGTINPFVFTLMNSGVSFLTIFIVLLFSDHVGRRFFLMLSSAVMGAGMMTMGGLGTANPVNKDESRAIVSMITVLGFGFGLGWGPMTYVVTTEVSALRLRDHTSRLGFGLNVLFNFLVNFSIPYLISAQYAGLSSKVGFIFGSIAFLALTMVYLFVPECKGKTLEQVDLLFSSGIPLRNFGQTDAAAMMRMETTSEVKEQGIQVTHLDRETSIA
ncbi:general substrate transporter [Thozetella sp. PMI_491]|nr:general substrate transporter [Thozetella sp. PMI_491]